MEKYARNCKACCLDAGQGRFVALALTNLIFQRRGLPVFSSFQDARRAFELVHLALNVLVTELSLQTFFVFVYCVVNVNWC